MKFVTNICLVSLLFTSCNFAPRYHRPCAEMPCDWRIESNDETTCANVRWWEELGDPVLNALISQALCNNKDLKVAIWRVGEFYARYQVESSLLYPQIDLDGFALKQRFPEQASFLPAGFDPISPHYRFAFNLDYEIDFWGRVRNLSQAASAKLLASVENRRTVVLSLVSAVAQSYILIRQLDRELEVACQTLEDRKEYLRIAKLRFEGGVTSEIEVTQATSAYEEALSVIVVLKELIPIQENLLSVLLGESPTCIVRGKAIDKFSLPCEIPAGLPSELLERRPDILEAEYQLISANAAIGAARAAFFPKISLTALYGGESFQLSKLFSGTSRAWALGANYIQQIFTGGRLKGELNLSIAQKQALLFQYEQTVLNAFKEVNDALIAHKQARELAVVEEQRVTAIKEYLRLSWLRYYNGQTEYLTVLDAERQLFSVEIDLTKAQGNTFSTLVDLYKSLGGGWVLDADRIVSSTCQ